MIINLYFLIIEINANIIYYVVYYIYSIMFKFNIFFNAFIRKVFNIKIIIVYIKKKFFIIKSLKISITKLRRNNLFSSIFHFENSFYLIMYF